MPEPAGDSATELQRRCLTAVWEYTKAQGYPPSHRELQKLLCLTSTNSVQEVLGRLEERGLLIVSRGVARGLRITDEGLEVLL